MFLSLSRKDRRELSPLFIVRFLLISKRKLTDVYAYYSTYTFPNYWKQARVTCLQNERSNTYHALLFPFFQFLRLLALMSLISVMLNTPKTFEFYPFLRYATFAVDLICVVAFSAEMVTKIRELWAGWTGQWHTER